VNLLELHSDIVHANSGDGTDYTLCGLTASNILSSPSLYTDEVRKKEDVELCPMMVRTDRKIDCERCAMIIRYCCKIGTKAISKRTTETEYDRQL